MHRSQIQSQLGDLHTLLGRLEFLENEPRRFQQEQRRRFKKHLPPPRMLNSCLMTLGVWVIAGFTAVVYLSGFVGGADTDAEFMRNGLLIYVVLPIVTPLAFGWYFRHSAKRRVASTNRAIDAHNAAVQSDIQHGVNRIAQQTEGEKAALVGIFRDSFDGLVPPRYLNAHDVGRLYELFANGRADSMKEAINLYEHVLHQERMIDMAQAQFEEQQRSTQAAETAAMMAAFTQQQTTEAIRREGRAMRGAMYRAAGDYEKADEEERRFY